MDIKLLRAFVTVAELRHFGRAADALHTSQPALSKQIGALESSLGARLFERGRHGAELTAFGGDFLADAAALVRDADDMLARAKEASSGKRGRLRVGLCLSVLTIAPRLIADFRRQHPKVDVTLVDLSSAEQARRLLAGTLDVGFMRMPNGRELEAFSVVEESLALAIRRAVPRARGRHGRSNRPLVRATPIRTKNRPRSTGRAVCPGDGGGRGGRGVRALSYAVFAA